MKPTEIRPGQLWINPSRPELGLGTVTDTSHRRATLAFPATSETLVYTLDDFPLLRACFSVADLIRDREGAELRIHAIEEADGLLVYRCVHSEGESLLLPESAIDPLTPFASPLARFSSNQLDSPSWFSLRRETLRQQQRLASNPLTGLGGGRTQLLPHQLYIAWDLSRRPEPRGLLADEVGLGKTIEACLVVHRRLLLDLDKRVLALVPAPLLHQWLVELLRRFNLQFTLLDEARCQELEHGDPDCNPFEQSQLILCTPGLLSGDARRLEQARSAGWDLLVVDEAHHLEWHADSGGSPEYRAVESLAAETPGVLLLTATPEQLGPEGHLARLRLLDRDRYDDPAMLQREKQHYRETAELAAHLLSAGAPEASLLQRLQETLPDQQVLITRYASQPTEHNRQGLLDLLLDRVGPGRSLFRNSRHAIQGFAQRRFHPAALQPDRAGAATRELTYPEHAAGTSYPWHQDPRFNWLVDLLKRDPQRKTLLITASAGSALALEACLRQREGIHAALFHERMSLLERDRSAAWFADTQEGCQLMICSEIGSEGRNFQFASQLVLMDLPSEPDLLEQRIGRLDRIGQQQTIDIHLPFFSGHSQEVLQRWYHEGLDAFEHTCAVGGAVRAQLQPLLEEALDSGQAETLQLLINSSRQLRLQLEQELNDGRDRLLELASCRQPQADGLRDELLASERDNPVQPYLEALMDHLGVEHERHSEQVILLRPGPQMISESIPGLPEQGLTGCFDREQALAHEQWQFLSWEHPLLQGAMELLLSSGRGNSSICAIRLPGVPAGRMLTELLYLADCPAPARLQIGRFLPPTLEQRLLDQDGQTLEIPSERLDAACKPLEKSQAARLARALLPRVRQLIEKSEPALQKHLTILKEEASRRAAEEFDQELARLRQLARSNPHIEPRQLTALQQQRELVLEQLGHARMRLEALRVLITS